MPAKRYKYLTRSRSSGQRTPKYPGREMNKWTLTGIADIGVHQFKVEPSRFAAEVRALR